jgi:hypothetical protein
MYANYTGKPAWNFYGTFQHTCQNTYTGDVCNQITKHRTRTLNWYKETKHWLGRIKCSLKCYLKNLWEWETFGSQCKNQNYGLHSVKKLYCLSFGICIYKFYITHTVYTVHRGAETCRSLILVMNCILLSAFVRWCIKCIIRLCSVQNSRKINMINTSHKLIMLRAISDKHKICCNIILCHKHAKSQKGRAEASIHQTA